MEHHIHDAYSHGECRWWIGDDDDWIGIGYDWHNDWIYVYYYAERLQYVGNASHIQSRASLASQQDGDNNMSIAIAMMTCILLTLFSNVDLI